MPCSRPSRQGRQFFIHALTSSGFRTTASSRIPQENSSRESDLSAAITTTPPPVTQAETRSERSSTPSVPKPKISPQFYSVLPRHVLAKLRSQARAGKIAPPLGERASHRGCLLRIPHPLIRSEPRLHPDTHIGSSVCLAGTRSRPAALRWLPCTPHSRFPPG
jgi:hypothetical protein